jgi:hypothetical protein
MDYVEVCPSGRVNVRSGRVVVGPCLPTVRVVYSLTGVTPQSTTSPGGQVFFIPRVNTFRPDGQFLIFFNQAGTFTERIRLFPCNPPLDRYGVDVFALSSQTVTITSIPTVPITVTSEQGGTQQKHQLIFTTSATVFVNVSA